MRIVDLHYHMPSSLWLVQTPWTDGQSVTAFEAVEPVLHPESRRELVGRYEMLTSDIVSELVSEGADYLVVRCISTRETFHAVLHEPPAHLTRLTHLGGLCDFSPAFDETCRLGDDVSLSVPRFLAQAVG